MQPKISALIVLVLLLCAEVASAQPDLEKSEAWLKTTGTHVTSSGFSACVDGLAAGYPCANVNLLSHLDRSDLGAENDILVNDLWGWTDSSSKRDFVILGREDGVSFIEVTSPESPVFLGSLPKTVDSKTNFWRDIKVYRDHAYVVADGALMHGMQVFDLRRLLSVSNPPIQFTETALYTEFGSAHNLWINEESGFAYIVGISREGKTCGGGLHMVDLRTPAKPVFAGCFSDGVSGRAGTGYTHDVECVIYSGPDVRFTGREICVASAETAISIADVTDKLNPVFLAAASYPGVSYVHQGAFSADQSRFYQSDELDEYNGTTDHTLTMIWDVTDLEDPVLSAVYTSALGVIDHNQYVVGDRLYQSNYTAGLRILDISDRDAPEEIAFFDTFPEDDDTTFGGSWSNYPFFENGVIAVSSRERGLFMVAPTFVRLSEIVAQSILGGVAVNWTVENSLTGVTGFEVQRSVDGSTYERVGQASFSPGVLDYSITDFAYTTTLPYYRIRYLTDGPNTLLYSQQVASRPAFPSETSLASVFPNPFGDQTVIAFSVDQPGTVKLSVFDTAGRLVQNLVDEHLTPGYYRFLFRSGSLPSGIYFYKLDANGKRLTGKMSIFR